MFIYFPRLLKLLGNITFPIAGITIFPFIFTSKPYNELSFRFKTHEQIHIAQQREFIILGIVLLLFSLIIDISIIPAIIFILFGYYLVYGLFFCIGYLTTRDIDQAYFDIPFETEAYENQSGLYYLETRPVFNWIQYVIK